MNIPLGETFHGQLVTHAAGGAAANADSTPTVTVDEEGTAMGLSITVSNVTTGRYKYSIAATGGNGFEVGKFYSVRGAATVDGVGGEAVLREFRIVAAEINEGAPLVELTSAGVAAAQSGLATVSNQSTLLANQTTILARIGAFTGSGLNTILGFLKAALSKAADLTPSDVGGTFDNTADSLEAARDNIGTPAASGIALVDLLEADWYVDTTQTPWDVVLTKKGTGAPSTLGGSGTVILRQDLKDVSGTNLTSTDTIVARRVG